MEVESINIIFVIVGGVVGGVLVFVLGGGVFWWCWCKCSKLKFYECIVEVDEFFVMKFFEMDLGYVLLELNSFGMEGVVGFRMKWVELDV